MLRFLKKLTGNATTRALDQIRPLVEEINRRTAELQPLPDDEVRRRSLDLRRRVREDADIAAAAQALAEKQAELEAESDPDRRIVLREEWKRLREALFQKEQRVLDAILPEAFALVREAARRTIGQVHFDSQLRGGIVLHQGKIAEMKTGEGKTLTATLPLYLNALAGHGAHLVTVNDYLARRDCGWMGEVFYFLGLTTGVVIPDFSGIYDPNYITEDVQGYDERLMHLRPCSRQDAYLADITYGTNNEFGFDYLRDNMARDAADIVQRELYYAIVDEVDNILIDEARTPLIISAPDEESVKRYIQFARVVNSLEEGDYEIEEKDRIVTLTDAGLEKVEARLDIDRGQGQSLYDAEHAALTYYLDSALKARCLYKKDVNYVVRDGQIVIVDEFTGRLMPGRRWSDGIHESIEAREREIYREKVEVQRESKTFATITFQNYFRLYQKLAGMSGTAVTEQEEFFKIYYLDVVAVPTHRPMIREDAPDRIYAREEAKLRAVVREILRNYCLGRPVLVGTTSVAVSERLAGYLGKEYLPLALLMPLLARALRDAPVGATSRRALPELFGAPLERFGKPFTELAGKALLTPDLLSEAVYARAAEQVERMLEAQGAAERRQRREEGGEAEGPDSRDAERTRERKKELAQERPAIRQALKEGVQGAWSEVLALLDLSGEEHLAKLRSALEQGLPKVEVLNAKYHEREALVIARAGQKGAVTIATSMAGRGVDIILGGDPTQRAYERLEGYLFRRDKSFDKIVETLMGADEVDSVLPRLRGYLPDPLEERLEREGGAAGVDAFLRGLAGWMAPEIEQAAQVREQLREAPLSRLLRQRAARRYPDLPEEKLAELVALIDKAQQRKPFERHELNAWAAAVGLGDFLDEAVSRARQLLRTEGHISPMRLQAVYAAQYGLDPDLAKELAERIWRRGSVPTRPYVVRWAQDNRIPRDVLEWTWQEYDYLNGMSLPERSKTYVAGRLYTAYMNALTALMRAALGRNSARAQALLAATPALPAFFLADLEQVRAECDRDREEILALGGLCITGTERHEARRIDNQLRGRAGRLGDPGYSQFYVSTEDELMRRFGPGADRMRNILERFADEETPIEARMISNMIEQAQVRVEGYHFDIRKHLVEYDDVLNRQRDVVYAERRRTLETEDPHGLVLARLREEIAERCAESFEPLRGRREYERDRAALQEAVEDLLEGIRTGRSRAGSTMPIYPVVDHVVLEGLRQAPVVALGTRVQELRQRLLAEGAEVTEEVRNAWGEIAELARQLGPAAAGLTAPLNGAGAPELAARCGEALAALGPAAAAALQSGLEEIVERMVAQQQKAFADNIDQTVARYLEQGETDESGLYLTRLYRELTRARRVFLPPAVNTASWAKMAPEEIADQVREAVRKQLADTFPRLRQKLLERVERVVRDWQQNGYDWLVVDRFLGEQRLPVGLAAEPLLDLYRGDLPAFQEALAEELYELARAFLEEREGRLGADLLRQIEHRYLLEAIDREWIDYLTAMEELRQGIGLRAYGQQDPLVEYRRESYNLFGRLMRRVRQLSLLYIFASAQVPPTQRSAPSARAAAPAREERPAAAGGPASRPAEGGKRHRKRRRK